MQSIIHRVDSAMLCIRCTMHDIGCRASSAATGWTPLPCAPATGWTPLRYVSADGGLHSRAHRLTVESTPVLATMSPTVCAASWTGASITDPLDHGLFGGPSGRGQGEMRRVANLVKG
ncbi:hypothetical protein GCM10009730_63560 [Streptomyces albidochromogenes]